MPAAIGAHHSIEHPESRDGWPLRRYAPHPRGAAKNAQVEMFRPKSTSYVPAPIRIPVTPPLEFAIEQLPFTCAIRFVSPKSMISPESIELSRSR
jgi:hypothetical protein